MNAGALEWFRCPDCGSELRLDAAVPGSTAGSALRCVSGAHVFPVTGGIPRFASGTNYADSFGLQWNLHRRTQLDSYTGLPISRNRLFETTAWSRDLRGERLLEAGCGSGRFTEVLLTTGAEVYSFDYSTAVDANYENHKGAPNLHLFQGDIFNIPLRRGAFDKVLCLGVLQHTADPEGAFRSLAACVKPGGELVIDVYARRLRSLLSWKYLLRPLTRRLDKPALYRAVERTVPALMPLAIALRRAGGRFGSRLLPIVEYSHLSLPAEVNAQWAVLDTFDMYSPEHDHPQSLRAVERWYRDAGFVDTAVRYGPNGITGRGRRPGAPPAPPASSTHRE